jgi:hypothetical protein
MYIHLHQYEPITFARAALYVREFPADCAGVDFVLRGGAAAIGVAGYAVDYPASFGTDWGGVAGTAGGSPGDGQHIIDAHFGDYAAAGVDCGAAGQGSAGTAAAAFAGRSGKTETRDTCLGRGASALEREIGRARMEKPFAADEPSHRVGDSSRRIAMKGFGNFTAGLIAVWFAYALIAGGFGLFQNQYNRIGAAVGIAAAVPTVLFAVWFAASDSFRKFALSLNPRTLTFLQSGRFIGVTFVILQARGVLPAIFAWPAGYGDMFIGATAALVAWKLCNPDHRGSFIFWQALGIFDLVTAVGLGTTAGLIQPHSVPMMAMTVLPLSLIPTFLVPLYLILHVICIAQARGWRSVSSEKRFGGVARSASRQIGVPER